MSFKKLVPCGNPIIRIECMVCDVLRSKDIDCGVKNMLELYRTKGYCESSDKGEKCSECKHLSYEMDDCVNNGFVAAVVRYVKGITEDNRHFEPRGKIKFIHVYQKKGNSGRGEI